MFDNVKSYMAQFFKFLGREFAAPKRRSGTVLSLFLPNIKITKQKVATVILFMF